MQRIDISKEQTFINEILDLVGESEDAKRSVCIRILKEKNVEIRCGDIENYIGCYYRDVVKDKKVAKYWFNTSSELRNPLGTLHYVELISDVNEKIYLLESIIYEVTPRDQSKTLYEKLAQQYHEIIEQKDASPSVLYKANMRLGKFYLRLYKNSDEAIKFFLEAKKQLDSKKINELDMGDGYITEYTKEFLNLVALYSDMRGDKSLPYQKEIKQEKEDKEASVKSGIEMPLRINYFRRLAKLCTKYDYANDFMKLVTHGFDFVLYEKSEYKQGLQHLYDEPVNVRQAIAIFERPALEQVFKGEMYLRLAACHCHLAKDSSEHLQKAVDAHEKNLLEKYVDFDKSTRREVFNQLFYLKKVARNEAERNQVNNLIVEYYNIELNSDYFSHGRNDQRLLENIREALGTKESPFHDNVLLAECLSCHRKDAELLKQACDIYESIENKTEEQIKSYQKVCRLYAGAVANDNIKQAFEYCDKAARLGDVNAMLLKAFLAGKNKETYQVAVESYKNAFWKAVAFDDEKSICAAVLYAFDFRVRHDLDPAYNAMIDNDIILTAYNMLDARTVNEKPRLLSSLYDLTKQIIHVTRDGCSYDKFISQQGKLDVVDEMITALLKHSYAQKREFLTDAANYYLKRGQTEKLLQVNILLKKHLDRVLDLCEVKEMKDINLAKLRESAREKNNAIAVHKLLTHYQGATKDPMRRLIGGQKGYVSRPLFLSASYTLLFLDKANAKGLYGSEVVDESENCCKYVKSWAEQKEETNNKLMACWYNKLIEHARKESHCINDANAYILCALNANFADITPQVRSEIEKAMTKALGIKDLEAYKKQKETTSEYKLYSKYFPVKAVKKETTQKATVARKQPDFQYAYGNPGVIMPRKEPTKPTQVASQEKKKEDEAVRTVSMATAVPLVTLKKS